VPKDILLDNNGDIIITENSDITLKSSVRQDVKIRLRWFFAEWRFGPGFGLPYYEDVFIKNPSPTRIAQIVREEVMKASDVTGVRNITVKLDSKTRNAVIAFVFSTDYGTFAEEVKIDV
jgi:hypothetical protein